MDKPKSFCGIFGIWGNENASLITYYGLHALQHRGQEATGILVRKINGNNKIVFNIVKGEGLVSEVYSDD
ncbi:MAG: amidophosphoribosyltransferase, partial [Ignavibacteria bacterium]|nr:amidophosphoribosyltransferase [Ignavibacteria bacterium]